VTFFLCAFGAFFVTQFAKACWPTPFRPWAKLGLTVAAAVGGAAAVQHTHPAVMVLLGVGSAGLAVVLHRGSRLLSVVGDWCIRMIMLSRVRNG